MPEAQCIKYPIRPGHREKVVDWLIRLEDRSSELVEALAEGGIVSEAVFLEKSGGGDYILIYTSARDLQAGLEALSGSGNSLVQEFNQLMAESLDVDNAVSLELIYHT